MSDRWLILIHFSGQKWEFKYFWFPPILKSRFSPYNLKKGGKARFSTGKFYFWQRPYIWQIQPWLFGLKYWRYVCQKDTAYCPLSIINQWIVLLKFSMPALLLDETLKFVARNYTDSKSLVPNMLAGGTLSSDLCGLRLLVVAEREGYHGGPFRIGFPYPVGSDKLIQPI